MKKNILKNFLGFIFAFVILFSSQVSWGQKPGRKAMREKIEAQQVAFITKQLNLTPEEAKTFWPLYNEFSEKRRLINKDRMEKARPLKEDSENLTEKQYREIAESELVYEQKILDLRKEYYNKFLGVLPASKVVKLSQADRQFKRMLLKRLGERNNKQGRDREIISE